MICTEVKARNLQKEYSIWFLVASKDSLLPMQFNYFFKSMLYVMIYMHVYKLLLDCSVSYIFVHHSILFSVSLFCRPDYSCIFLILNFKPKKRERKQIPRTHPPRHKTFMKPGILRTKTLLLSFKASPPATTNLLLKLELEHPVK